MKQTAEAFDRSLSRRRFLSTSALAGLGLAGGSTVLSACGGGGGGGGAGGTSGGEGGGTVTWGSWANPGEAERFRAYSKDYQEKNGTKVTWQNVVGDYPSKMLTQLAGGSAPDVFYVGDTLISKAIDAKVLAELGADADIKAVFDKTYPGLRAWAQSADNKIYGIDVDCNPKVFWFNKNLLTEAGVADDPAAAFEKGAWNRDALEDMLTKIKATGKRGMPFESGWGDLFSWITTFGGTVFDEQNKAVFDTDPKAQEAIAWLLEQMKSENITYAGSLPKGQGVDALFYSGQLATIQYGRWILPNLKKLKGKIAYDIAPMPSESGKDVMPVAVFTACMSINAKAKDPETAKKFLADYCGEEGQKFRLSGGGNAVPSIPGLDEIVTEGNDPPHGKYFSEIASKGYAVPLPLIRSAKKSADFPLKNDVLLKSVKDLDAKKYSAELVKLLNGS
ncbi:MAG TPA: extracellular solute-binding protein [Propionibacteriaceae bacterium]|nr:extracellular solute-binding protein [Propionibacteriaceae bacterium]